MSQNPVSVPDLDDAVVLTIEDNFAITGQGKVAQARELEIEVGDKLTTLGLMSNGLFESIEVTSKDGSSYLIYSS